VGSDFPSLFPFHTFALLVMAFVCREAALHRLTWSHPLMIRRMFRHRDSMFCLFLSLFGIDCLRYAEILVVDRGDFTKEDYNQ